MAGELAIRLVFSGCLGSAVRVIGSSVARRGNNSRCCAWLRAPRRCRSPGRGVLLWAYDESLPWNPGRREAVCRETFPIKASNKLRILVARRRDKSGVEAKSGDRGHLGFPAEVRWGQEAVIRKREAPREGGDRGRGRAASGSDGRSEAARHLRGTGGPLETVGGVAAAERIGGAGEAGGRGLPEYSRSSDGSPPSGGASLGRGGDDAKILSVIAGAIQMVAGRLRESLARRLGPTRRNFPGQGQHRAGEELDPEHRGQP